MLWSQLGNVLLLGPKSLPLLPSWAGPLDSRFLGSEHSASFASRGRKRANARRSSSSWLPGYPLVFLAPAPLPETPAPATHPEHAVPHQALGHTPAHDDLEAALPTATPSPQGLHLPYQQANSGCPHCLWAPVLQRACSPLAQQLCIGFDSGNLQNALSSGAADIPRPARLALFGEGAPSEIVPSLDGCSQPLGTYYLELYFHLPNYSYVTVNSSLCIM